MAICVFITKCVALNPYISKIQSTYCSEILRINQLSVYLDAVNSTFSRYNSLSASSQSISFKSCELYDGLPVFWDSTGCIK